MLENVDNPVVEHLKLIRADISEGMGRPGNVDAGQQALQGMIFGLSRYIRGIDVRALHIEQKQGIDQ